MGRPKDPLRRARIVRQALASFAAHGYAGCTMREIAKGCGLAETQLYRDFRGKDELLDAALDYVEQRQKALCEAIWAAASSTDRVQPFLERAGIVLMCYVEDMAPWYALWFTQPPLTQARRARLASGEEAVFRALAATLERRGTLRDPCATARLFAGAILGNGLLQARAAFEPCSAEMRRIALLELIATIVDGAASGISARPILRSYH